MKGEKDYVTVGDLRKMLEGIDDRYIVYVRVDEPDDGPDVGDVFLKHTYPKMQDRHRIWWEGRDADFVCIYGFTEA